MRITVLHDVEFLMGSLGTSEEVSLTENPYFHRCAFVLQQFVKSFCIVSVDSIAK